MAELKPCPVLVASPIMDGTLCIQQHCAWWCEPAGCCSVKLIAIEAWNRRAVRADDQN